MSSIITDLRILRPPGLLTSTIFPIATIVPITSINWVVWLDESDWLINLLKAIQNMFQNNTYQHNLVRDIHYLYPKYVWMAR